jgi:hypothetical protein
VTIVTAVQLTGVKNVIMTAVLALLKHAKHVDVKNVKRVIKMVKKWINSRIEERTSWDGAVLIAVGLVILIAGPFAKLAAYIAIGYGAWTIYKSE